MKKLLLIGMIAVAASAVQAKIVVDFATGPDTLSNASSGALATDSLYLTYWSSDMSIDFDPATPGNSADTLLNNASTTVFPPLAGQITGNTGLVFGEGSNLYEGGYLFIVVYDVPAASYTGSFVGGENYGVGPLSGQLPVYDVTAPNYDYGALVQNITTEMVVDVVPEPSTMALGLLGLGALVIRRLRRRD